MVDVNDALHDAVSSSIVQICQELFSFHSFVMVTGSLMFNVDGQQQMNVEIENEIAVTQTVLSSNNRTNKNAGNKGRNNDKANGTISKRHRGCHRKSRRVQQQRSIWPIHQMSAAAEDDDDDDDDDDNSGDFAEDSCDRTNLVRHRVKNHQAKEPTENHLQQLEIPRQQSADDIATVKMESTTTDESVSAEIKREHVVDHKHRAIESRKRFTCNSCDFATDHRRHYNQHIARRCPGNLKQPITVNHCEKELSVGSVKRHSKKAVSSDVIMSMTPCPCCEEKFDTAAKLDGHLRDDHHDVTHEITSCRSCSFRFISAEQLQKHVETTHSNRCVTCSKTFADRQMLKSHRDAVHAESSLTCTVCGQQCATHRALQRHVTSHDGATKPRVSCDECEKSFTSASTLYHHKRAIHGPGKPYECLQCGARFNFNHSLTLHVLKHAGRRPHQCPTCGKSYLTASHLKHHVDAIHSATKRFVCNVCHKSFPYQTSYKLHRRLHTGDRPFTCPTCGKSFVTRGALREHEKIHSSGNSESQNQHRCEVCDRGYRTAALLRAHRRRHTADAMRHVCEVCGRTFMYRSNLEVHLSVHTTERAFPCSTCGKSFKTASTLYTHQVVHLSETATSHVCTKCGKSFKTKQRLRAHESRHSDAKPFVCRSCGGAFPDRGGLAKHLRTVHAARARFACPTCGKTANRLDNLRVHMRTHGDPSLINLTAEELTVSAKVDLIFDKERAVDPVPETVVPTPSASVDNSVPAEPVSAFCLLPKKSDVVENHHQLPRYAAAAVGAGTVTGSAAIDLFHDSSAYVQHCLSFVALPTTDYIPQTEIMTINPLTYIHQQP